MKTFTQLGAIILLLSASIGWAEEREPETLRKVLTEKKFYELVTSLASKNHNALLIHGAKVDSPWVDRKIHASVLMPALAPWAKNLHISDEDLIKELKSEVPFWRLAALGIIQGKTKHLSKCKDCYQAIDATYRLPMESELEAIKSLLKEKAKQAVVPKTQER